MRQLTISTGWQCKTPTSEKEAAQQQAPAGDGWVPAQVPGTAALALTEAGLLPDPYRVAHHERWAQTFGEDALFRCSFEVPPQLQGRPLLLCLEGLDTVATVFVNGSEVARSDNMFVPLQVRIESLLRPHQNELLLVFTSALRAGQQRQQEHGARAVWNGDPSRVYVRKAQYHWGWDFGMALLSMGPWQPVRLVAADGRIAEVHAPIVVTEDLTSAQVAVTATIECVPSPFVSSELEVELQLLSPTGAVVATQKQRQPAGNAVITHTFSVEQPALWWPRGYGAQPLYTLQVLLRSGDEVLDQQQLKLGIRHLRVCEEVQRDGAPGFYFAINHQPIFCGGANWIPADIQTTRVTPALTRQLVGEAAAMGCTMLRVWGGGIYESDAFYEACDELGLLCWQDFMFACGMYPGLDGFAASVQAEAAVAIRRLRHHPSLVLWAGNNEDYAIAQSTGCYDGPSTTIPTPAGPSEKARFDGRRIYEQTLAEQVRSLDPTRMYWPGSPYSRHSADPNDKREGDRHIWEVWHSPLRDYQDYPQLAGRFVSEFGMQGVPSEKTLERALLPGAVTQERLPLLNKGQDGPMRLSHYIEHNLGESSSLATYAYATQLLQAESLAYAMRGFRRRFGGPGGQLTSGALLWQLNDCWPGISWSVLEYLDAQAQAAGHGVTRKPSFYAVRRELQPLVLGLAPATDGAVQVWAGQTAGRVLSARLVLRAFFLDGTLHATKELAVQLRPNQTTELGALMLPAASQPVIVGAQLWQEGTLLARSVLWPQPLRSLPLQDPQLTVTLETTAAGTAQAVIVARKPAKAVLLSSGDSVQLADNLVDLLPDEVLSVPLSGIPTAPLQVRSLYSELRR